MHHTPPKGRAPAVEPLDLCARHGLLTPRECEAGARFGMLYRAVHAPRGPALPAWYGRAADDGPDPEHLAELGRELRDVLDRLPPAAADAVVAACARREWPRAASGLALLRDGLGALADLWRIEDRTPAARWADAIPAPRGLGHA